MANFFHRGCRASFLLSSQWEAGHLRRSRHINPQSQRYLQKQAAPHQAAPDFAFAFDIDGVLLRGSQPLPRAHRALAYLQTHYIPFILLTNGGGKHESDRVAELSDCLSIPLATSLFVQSHTPFAELVHGTGAPPSLKDKCILVLGGDGEACRRVAEMYGFTNVVTPADILTANPSVWPFSHAFAEYYAPHARPLPKPLVTNKLPDLAPETLAPFLKIDAVFVYHDPRDWALDTQLVMDLLLSHQGYIGTLSPLNNDATLPNRGFQQDGQPPLYFCNPDLWWAAGWHLPRLGQGGFRTALEGVWAATTGGPAAGVELRKTMFGKPHRNTYAFAERTLVAHRERMLGTAARIRGLTSVYMVGDNPESDIRGASTYASTDGSKWFSILVRTGVYSDGKPSFQPTTIVDDVWDAVRWGLEREGWRDKLGDVEAEAVA